MNSSLGLDDFLKELNQKQTPNPNQATAPKKQNYSQNITNLNKSKTVISTGNSDKFNQKGVRISPIKERISISLLENTDVFGNDVFEKTEIKKSSLIFENKAFVFIPYGTDFTKKQIEILSESIRKQKGITFEFNFFDWKPLSFIDLSIVTSKQMPYEALLEIVAEKFHKQLPKFIFIDYKWISKCLEKSFLADISPYIIKWEKDKKPENEESKNLRDINTNEQVLKTNLNNTTSLKRNLNKTDFDIDNKGELELESVNDEAHLLRPPTKRVRKNDHTIRNCRDLLEFADNPLIFHAFEEENASIHSQKTEILSEEELPEGIEFDSQEYSSDVMNKIEFENQMTHLADSKLFGMNELHPKNEDLSSNRNFLEEIQVKKFEGDKFFPNQVKFEEDEEVQILPKGFDPCLKGIEKYDGEYKVFQPYNPIDKDKVKYWDERKEEFVCQMADAKNLNNHITDELDKMQRICANEKETSRRNAYRRAISIIKSLSFKIEKETDVKNIPVIGEHIKEKIKEILRTGKLRNTRFLIEDQQQQTVETLSRIFGIGTQFAIDLYHKGIHTIADLRRNEHLLTDNMKTGLKYFEEFEQRIPRDEATEIIDIVKSKVEEVAEDKHVFELICCGSYRRGKATCGDVDILVTRKDGKPFGTFLNRLVKSLEGILLTDHLIGPKLGSFGNETYNGVCRIRNGLHRRIDIKLFQREHFGYAVLYFTGSELFNRSMRLFARKKGLTLSEHGLFPAIRVNKKKVWIGQSIPCFTEEDVFRALNLKYKAPHEREV